MKKILAIALAVIFSLGILGGGSEVAFATLNAPSPLSIPEENIGEGSVKLQWEWTSGGGTINRFVLSFRVAGTAEEWRKRYPSASTEDYTLMGLTGNTTYEWTLMAEAENPADNSTETSGNDFTTKTGAVDDNGNGNGWPGIAFDLENPLQADTLEEALENLIKFLFFIVMALAPILIIYAAFLILTSGGDSAKVIQGRRIIFWTLIAVAIVIFARGFTAVIKGILGG